MILIWMPRTLQNRNIMTSPFVSFTNCRCIIDCTEVQCAKPRESLEEQSQTFSHYKQRNTLEGLFACSPHGAITFCSNLYGGSASNRKIFTECGILKLLDYGDLILADKGFNISQDLLPLGVNLNIPPFLHGVLTHSEAKLSTRIARARIHVERVIGRMKNYRILDYISANLRTHASSIFQLVACLINLHNPLLLATNDSDSET